MNEENASLSSPIFLSLSISLTLYLSLFISLSYAFLPFSFVGNAPSDDKEELLGKRLSFCRRKDEKMRGSKILTYIFLGGLSSSNHKYCGFEHRNNHVLTSVTNYEGKRKPLTAIG